MYEEQVKQLRDKASKLDYDGWVDTAASLEEAANIIEALEFTCDIYEKDYKALWAYVPKWIPVTETPALKVGDKGYPGYLVYANGYYDVADYGVDRLGNGPRFLNEYDLDITHYMPLPEPPERLKEET